CSPPKYGNPTLATASWLSSRLSTGSMARPLPPSFCSRFQRPVLAPPSTAAASAVVLFQVPASRPGAAVDGGLAPPEADAAVGRTQIAGKAVVHQRLPVGVVVLPQRIGQLRSAQEMVGHQVTVALFQLHQHRHVGVAL